MGPKSRSKAALFTLGFFALSLFSAAKAPPPARFLFKVSSPPIIIPSDQSQTPQEKKAPPGPLSKAHAHLEGDANCAKCHAADNKFSAGACLACHKPIADRIAAKKGVHRDVTGDCEICHAEHRGRDADLMPIERENFDHREEAGFSLDGKHAATAETCGKCHPTRSFLDVKPSCQSCHQDPHQGAMKESCAACHTPAGWATPARGFHKGTDFPLEGRHLTVACASCHLNGVVKGTPKRCYDCHWIRRQDDPYRTRLGNSCEECHNPTAWTAVSWEHGVRTGQPLNGAHRTLNCDGCHKNQTFKGTSPDCYACHRTDFEQTGQPNHLAAGFPTTCEACHKMTDSSFNQGTLNHDPYFPRVGVHATLNCAACHKNNVYQGTPRDCYGCHRTDFEQTSQPNHLAAGFPTTCEVCHRATDSSFNQGTFNHNPYFPRVGVHATLNCAACHNNNVYQGTPRDCYGCHRTDYEQTSQPNHLTAGFPTTCEACHKATDSSFNQGTVNHIWFPIASGRHAGNSCSACHPNPNNYQSFSCLTCHTRSSTDSDHDETSGYVYNSVNCYTCHPQGRA